jgi:hypothetical protein
MHNEKYNFCIQNSIIEAVWFYVLESKIRKKYIELIFCGLVFKIGCDIFFGDFQWHLILDFGGLEVLIKNMQEFLPHIIKSNKK